jgi:predicted nucleic acid-binding protein
MADLLVDSDIFIDHLRGARVLDVPRGAFYSIVIRAELFAGRTDESNVQVLLLPYRELAVERSTAEEAGRLRREHRMQLSDALIAATALQNELTLVTRNRRHFDRVRGLKIHSPG